MIKIIFILIFFIFNSSAIPSEYDLEINALLLLMQSENNEESNLDKKISKKYHTIPINKCNCLIKVQYQNKFSSYDVNTCNKKIKIITNFTL